VIRILEVKSVLTNGFPHPRFLFHYATFVGAQIKIDASLYRTFEKIFVFEEKTRFLTILFTERRFLTIFNDFVLLFVWKIANFNDFYRATLC